VGKLLDDVYKAGVRFDYAFKVRPVEKREAAHGGIHHHGSERHKRRMVFLSHESEFQKDQSERNRLDRYYIPDVFEQQRRHVKGIFKIGPVYAIDAVHIQPLNM